MTRMFLAALAAFGMALPVQAADPSGKFNLRGAGAMRCDAAAAALSGKDPRSAAGIADWLMGYATAWNRLNPGTFDALPGADGRSLAGLVLALCRTNPAASLETATASGLRLLAPLEATRDGPVVAFAPQTPLVTKGASAAVAPVIRPIVLHAEAVRVIERKLKALGHYSAAETGTASPALTNALRAFQTASKLAPTGLPDMPTLVRLMQVR